MEGLRKYRPSFLPSRRPSFRQEDYFVSFSNRQAYEWVLHQHWTSHCTVLVGPHCSGKTHLGRIWASRNSALVVSGHALNTLEIDQQPKRLFVDDAEIVAGDRDRELNLLYRFNILSRTGGSLLLSSIIPPTRWRFDLADLRSRLEGSALTEIPGPDEKLLQALIAKLFADRQISVGRHVVRYIAERSRRSYQAVHEMVEQLDMVSLEAGRPISLPMVRQILTERIV